MMKERLLGFLTCFLTLILVGCGHTQTAGLTIDSEYQQILFGDRSMAQIVEVSDISTSQVNDHARGVVRVKNKTSSDQGILYRFYWYDDQGLEVNTQPGPWKQLILRGKETRTLSEVSVSPKGTHFRVQIRKLQ
jgi:uncharacterized protein YcfL